MDRRDFLKVAATGAAAGIAAQAMDDRGTIESRNKIRAFEFDGVRSPKAAGASSISDRATSTWAFRTTTSCMGFARQRSCPLREGLWADGARQTATRCSASG